MPFKLFLSMPAVLLVVVLACGCGSGNTENGPELVPVTGTVMLGSDPLTDADLTFTPIEKTEGVGGKARSGADGSFVVQYYRGGEGLPVGKYAVAVSKRLMPDGSAVPADDETPPIESPAQESLPTKYTNPDLPAIKVDVEPGKALDIKLDS